MEAELIIHVIISPAVGLSIVFVLGIGCVLSPQEGSMLTSHHSLYYAQNSLLYSFCLSIIIRICPNSWPLGYQFIKYFSDC